MASCHDCVVLSLQAWPLCSIPCGGPFPPMPCPRALGSLARAASSLTASPPCSLGSVLGPSLHAGPLPMLTQPGTGLITSITRGKTPKRNVPNQLSPLVSPGPPASHDPPHGLSRSSGPPAQAE